MHDSTARFEENTFQDNYESVVAEGASRVEVTNSTFTGNDYGVTLYDTSTANSHNNTYTGNGAAFEVYDNATATITEDNFEGNGTAILSENPAGTEAHFNRFYNNGVAIENISGGADAIQADDNWRGDNQGGSVAGRTTGKVDFSQWLALDITASKNPIMVNGDTTQLTTDIVSTDGTSNTPLANTDMLGIQSYWFKYSSNVTLNTPGMGTLNGNTFASGGQAGEAGFSDIQFDDQTPTTKVTIITGRALPLNPPGPNPPGNPGGSAAPAPVQQAVIPVTGDSLVNLLCGGASQLLLANGNTVLIPALTPCTMQASLQSEAKETLPGPLPDGVQFVDALAVSVIDGGNPLDSLPQESLMQIDFAAPQVQANGSLAVYWWNGNAWQEVPATNSGIAETNSTGVFALVTK